MLPLYRREATRPFFLWGDITSKTTCLMWNSDHDFVIQNSHALFWKGGSDGSCLCLTGRGRGGGGWALPEALKPLFPSSTRRLTSSQNLFLSSWSLGTRPGAPLFSSSSTLITAAAAGNGDAMLIRGVDSLVRRWAMMIAAVWRRVQLETVRKSREPGKKEKKVTPRKTLFYSQGTGQLGKRSSSKMKDRARTNKSQSMYNLSIIYIFEC